MGGIAYFPGFVEISNMSTRRTVRVAEVLRKVLAACMSQSLDLEGLIITISSVELPPDMRQAYIYVSTLHPDLEEEQALHVLNRNRKAWQSFIGRRLGLKHVQSSPLTRSSYHAREALSDATPVAAPSRR